MKIKTGAANPFAADTHPEDQERFVLVENCWDEEIAWPARARYSDTPGSSKTVDYNWNVGDDKRIEENYAKAVFGAWDIKKDEDFIRYLTEQMQKQASKWPTPAPPHVKIYAENEDGSKGEELYDTHVAWLDWLEKTGRTELPRRTTTKHHGTKPPPMPVEMEQMNKAELMDFAKSIKFPIPESWSELDMREILFQFAPKHMLLGAIKQMQTEADDERKAETKKRSG